jgi:hypothetical protein
MDFQGLIGQERARNVIFRRAASCRLTYIRRSVNSASTKETNLLGGAK